MILHMPIVSGAAILSERRQNVWRLDQASEEIEEQFSLITMEARQNTLYASNIRLPANSADSREINNGGPCHFTPIAPCQISYVHAFHQYASSARLSEATKQQRGNRHQSSKESKLMALANQDVGSSIVLSSGTEAGDARKCARVLDVLFSHFIFRRFGDGFRCGCVCL